MMPNAKRPKLDTPEEYSRNSIIQDLRKELDRSKEELRRKDEELSRKEEQLNRKEEALREAGQVIGWSYMSTGQWNNMPEALRNEPGVLAEYLSQMSPLLRHQREYFPDDVLHRALPQLLNRHLPVVVRALESDFFSWDDISPFTEVYKESESLLSKATNQRDLVVDLSRAPFQELVLVALRKEPARWDYIPEYLKKDVEFCSALLSPPQEHAFQFCFCKFSELAKRVFGLHRRTLFRDPRVWAKIADFSAQIDEYQCISPAAQLFEDEHYQPVTQPDVVQYACTQCPFLVQFIDQVAHQEFVRQRIMEDRSILFQLKHPFLDAFPDFFMEQFALVDRTLLDRVNDEHPANLFGQLPRDIQTNPDVVNTWIRFGLPLSHRNVVAEWEVDLRETLLWIVQHGPRQKWRVDSFAVMPQTLQDDIEFISSAMEFEPAILRYASTLLQRNADLMTMAYGDPYFVERGLLPTLLISRAKHGTLPEEFLNDMNVLAANLRLQQCFKNVFLVAVGSTSQKESLGMLRNRVYLKSIRDYAGISSGQKLLRIRQALATVKSTLESRRIDIPTTWST